MYSYYNFNFTEPTVPYLPYVMRRLRNVAASSSVDGYVARGRNPACFVICAPPRSTDLYLKKIETESSTLSSFKNTMFAELNFAKTINRFKANKGVKPQRVMKYAYEKHWKAQKNRAMQVQSRAESEFDEDTLQPEKHLTRWEQHYAQHQRQAAYPLGAGW